LKATIQTRTRQFAKRQMTWFRNLDECQPIVITGTETPEDIAESLVRQAAETPARSNQQDPRL
jgi:tRNA dimethylallyltransferase